MTPQYRTGPSGWSPFATHTHTHAHILRLAWMLLALPPPFWGKENANSIKGKNVKRKRLVYETASLRELWLLSLFVL